MGRCYEAQEGSYMLHSTGKEDQKSSMPCVLPAREILHQAAREGHSVAPLQHMTRMLGSNSWQLLPGQGLPVQKGGQRRKWW